MTIDKELQPWKIKQISRGASLPFFLQLCFLLALFRKWLFPDFYDHILKLSYFVKHIAFKKCMSYFNIACSYFIVSLLRTLFVVKLHILYYLLCHLDLPDRLGSSENVYFSCIYLLAPLNVLDLFTSIPFTSSSFDFPHMSLSTVTYST